MKKNNKILHSFCSKDEMREWMQKPFRLGRRVYSTDAYMLASIDESKLDSFEEFSDEYGDKIKKVLTDDRDINLEISLEEVQKIVSDAPQQDSYDTIGADIECSECYGEGEVEWEYEGHARDFDCPICDGEGMSSLSKQIKNGKTQLKDHLKIDIGNSRFNISKFQKLIDVAVELSENSITLICDGKPNKGSLFKIKDFEIILMPVIQGDDDFVIAKL